MPNAVLSQIKWDIRVRDQGLYNGAAGRQHGNGGYWRPRSLGSVPILGGVLNFLRGAKSRDAVRSSSVCARNPDHSKRQDGPDCFVASAGQG